MARPSRQSCAQTPQPHACLSRQLVLSHPPPALDRPTHLRSIPDARRPLLPPRPAPQCPPSRASPRPASQRAPMPGSLPPSPGSHARPRASSRPSPIEFERPYQCHRTSFRSRLHARAPSYKHMRVPRASRPRCIPGKRRPRPRADPAPVSHGQTGSRRAREYPCVCARVRTQTHAPPRDIDTQKHWDVPRSVFFLLLSMQLIASTILPRSSVTM